MNNTCESPDKKRIVKNTMLLYVRMFLMMGVGLYTSRVVLNTLGISDYGVYNLVGGIVTTLSFLSSAMTAASQRFISYELGRKNVKRLKLIFSTSVNIHLIISIVILLLAETIGLWFVNTYLNIAPERMLAANWVYQFSIFTFIISVLSVPYNSCIIAHEHMKAFAYISILEAVLRLVIVYALLIIQVDKLILYGILVFAVSVLIRLCYTVYCKRFFEECHYSPVFDRKLFREMFSFAGWSIFGNMGFTFKDQISNVILNLFFGTTMNAARGIAIQVSGLINSFAGNFSMALNPQITKQYAGGNISESQKLVYSGARYTFYLLVMISIPVMINLDYVLELWLVTVPAYTAIFLKLSLVAALLYTLTVTVTVAIQATGRVKVFQVGICILMLSELPVAYFLLKLNMPPYSVMYPTIVTYVIAVFFRFYLLKRMVPSYNFTYYTVHVFLRSVVLFIVCYCISDYVHGLFMETILNMFITSFLSLGVVVLIIYVLGMTGTERKLVNMKVMNYVLRVCK